ncbi:MAG: sugar ABC transporter substrate-binding protein [Firmicutes bacterium]|nr:sugar ABC transporter substrate-binding protein [Bacillota bacterium]
MKTTLRIYQLIGMALALTMFFGLVVFQGVGFAAPKATIKFVAALYSEATEPYWQGVIKEFEKQNPDIKVELEVVNWDSIYQKVNTLVATRQAPDLLNIDFWSHYAADDLLLPLDNLLPAKMKDGFIKSFYDSGKMDGKQYVLPLVASIRALFYNKDHFKKAGVAKPPATWDELVAAGQKLAKLPNVSPFGLDMSEFEGQAFLAYFLWGGGADWKDAKGNWAYNSPKAVEALQFMVDLVRKYKITNPEPTVTSRDDLQKVFAAGRLSMMITASFFPTLLKDQLRT